MQYDASAALETAGVLDPIVRHAALRAAHRLGLKPIEALILTEALDPETLAKAIAACARVPAWTEAWPPTGLGAEVRHRLPADIAAEHRAIPIGVANDGDLIVAMADALDEAACDEIRFFAHAGIERIVIPAPQASLLINAIYDIRTPFLDLWRGDADRVGHQGERPRHSVA